LPCVPDDLGPVTVAGRACPTAVAHRYIDGRPLVKGQAVHDQFFTQLKETLRAIHDRGMAYLDLNKRENIIVDEQGDPHLIDFQVHFRLSRRWPGSSRPMRALLRSLQRADDYHLLKHHRELRPDQLTPGQADLDALRPPWIRFWRRWYTPLKNLRRRWLVRAGIRSGRGLPHTERDPEDVHRHRDGSPASHP